MEKVVNWITEKETHDIKYYDDYFGGKTTYNVYKEAE